MHVLAAARFSASNRLENRSRSINLMLALLSAVVIVASILPVSFELDFKDERIVALTSLSAAVFVMVLSLYQWSSRDDVNAERYLQNALKIADLRKRVEIARFTTMEDLNWAISEYNTVLRECGINHDTIDFIKAKIITNTYKGSLLRRCADHLYLFVRRLPALAYVSSIILFGVALATLKVLDRNLEKGIDHSAASERASEEGRIGQ